jgi:LacI family transcriptional regulator
MTTTIADVAARAGVSPATVSRVLNGNYPVAGATRDRVMRAVVELEYEVNGPARALAAATSDLVGVLVNDIADPFFGILASAAQTEIALGRKLAVVCNTAGSPEAELTYLTLLRRQRAAGVVLTGSAVEGDEHAAALTERLTRLAADGTRVVLCGRPAPTGHTDPQGGEPTGITTLAFANREGARRLTAHLTGLGHRRIGYVAGPAGRTTTVERLAGHRAALAGAGLGDHGQHLVVHGDYTRESGRLAALGLLKRAPDLTAVVAANDTVALGVCAGVRELGLRVPQDISVTGFDDLPFSVDASPALTTVRLPLREAGARAGRLVMGREPAPAGGVATIDAGLVVRASTAPPPPAQPSRTSREARASGGARP